MNLLLCVCVFQFEKSMKTWFENKGIRTFRADAKTFFSLLVAAHGFELYIHISLNGVTYSKTVTVQLEKCLS